MKKNLIRFVLWAFAFPYFCLFAQDIKLMNPDEVGLETNPYYTTCPNKGESQHFCTVHITKDDKEEIFYCKAKSEGICPQLEDCMNEYNGYLNEKEEGKGINIRDISRNSKLDDNGDEVPRELSCELAYKQDKYVGNKHNAAVKCGQAIVYVHHDQGFDKISINGTLLDQSLFRDLTISAGLLANALKGYSKGLPDYNEKLSKIRAVLSSKGIVEFDEEGKPKSEATVQFSHTAKSLNDEDQVEFYNFSGHASDVYQHAIEKKKLSICPNETNQYCFMAKPTFEIKLPYCDEAIIRGEFFCDAHDGDDKWVQGLSCFVPPKTVYCVDTMKCGYDDYSQNQTSYEFKKAKFIEASTKPTNNLNKSKEN